MRARHDAADFSEAVLALGEARFPRILLEALDPVVRVDHVAIIAFDREIVPHLIGAASRLPGNVALAAGRQYEESGFYRYDPGAQQLHAGKTELAPSLFRLRARDIEDGEYRRRIYTGNAILERLSLIQQTNMYWIMLNLYRGSAAGEFKRGEIKAVRQLSSLLAALAGKHCKLIAPDPASADPQEPALDIESLLVAINDRLTLRERAVCVRALRGLTVEGIALDLGIRPTTVATLRRRAYAKLHISSLNELFALCITQLVRLMATTER